MDAWGLAEATRLPSHNQATVFWSLPQVSLVELAAPLQLDNNHNKQYDELQIMSLYRALTLHNFTA